MHLKIRIAPCPLSGFPYKNRATASVAGHIPSAVRCKDSLAPHKAVAVTIRGRAEARAE